MDRTPDRSAARLARLGGLAIVAPGVAAGAVYVLIPFVTRAFVGGIAWLAAGCVWLATSISMGVSVGTLLATMWRGMAGALVTPAASAVLWGLVAIGAVALFWLQQLLGPGSEEE